MMKKKVLTGGQARAYRPRVSESGFISTEFPFVATLNRVEKSRWARAREAFQLLKLAQDRHGFLVPQALAASLGAVTRQRIDQLAIAGKLERVYVNEHAYITERSLIEWLEAEADRGGRPRSGVKVAVGVAVEAGREFYRAHRKSS